MDGTNEKILYGITNSSASQNDKKEGVLVIDPNKVVVNYNGDKIIKDRYINQEDLMIYTNLKIIKKAEETITLGSDGSISSKTNNIPIYINFLNPFINKKTPEGYIKTKDVQTNDWTDFFTQDSAINPSADDYIIDSESFGISDIKISINASNLPRVIITFIDIQGRLLFQNGNDPNNPYNIFFTYPYPKFLLTYKGYYGKAVETPLVLRKSDIKFDSNNGNYTITAEFESEIFAIFNSFLIIYAYVAPYMFKTNDGSYLGKKILEKLYENQNNKFKNLFPNERDYKKYKILESPTLIDLSGALLKIPATSFSKSNKETSDTTENLLKIKLGIDSYDNRIKTYLYPDGEKYLSINDSVNKNIITPKYSTYYIDKDIELQSYIKDINDKIKEFIDIINTNEQNILNELKNNINNIKKDTNKDIKITNDLFYYKKKEWVNDNPQYWLSDYNKYIGYIDIAISKYENILIDKNIEERVQSIGQNLGYEPNLNNVIRIISNNMQVFLILLDLVGKNAIKQLLKKDIRRTNQEQNGNYKETYDKKYKYLTAFPNYYEQIIDRVDNKNVVRNLLTYPGSNKDNSDWLEVGLVEEIYSALDRIKSDVLNSEENNLPTQKVDILSVFQLGEKNLENYENKKDSTNILGELISKIILYLTYSGLLYRGIPDNELKENIINSIVGFEKELLSDSLSNESDSIKYVIGNQIPNMCKSFDENDIKLTNYGNLVFNTILKPNQYKKFEELFFINALQTLINDNTEENNEKLNNVILDKIKNKTLYKKLSYSEFDNIKNYSVSSNGKETPIQYNLDLSMNKNYYSTKYSLLDTISSITLDKTQIESNKFMGFFNKMNQVLSEVKINNDFSREVTYNGTKINALTFNTTYDDILGDEENNQIYYKLYNTL